MKVMTLRRDGSCAGCHLPLPAGTRAEWDAVARTTRCLPCASTSSPAVAAAAVDVVPAQAPAPMEEAAGSSAQREHDRRAAKRESLIRARHPRLGGLVLALTDAPSSTRVWAQGAAGERAVAAKLAELEGSHVVALHDRRMRRPDGRASRANIDHLAIAATGVWVIDAKKYDGALEVRRSGGLFSPRVERLYIAGRDRTSLLDGLADQVEAVRTSLASVDADLPVRGALCFVGTELPWFGEGIGGVPLVGRRGLAKLLKKDGDLSAEERTAIAAYLAQQFVPA